MCPFPLGGTKDARAAATNTAYEQQQMIRLVGYMISSFPLRTGHGTTLYYTIYSMQQPTKENWRRTCSEEWGEETWGKSGVKTKMGGGGVGVRHRWAQLLHLVKITWNRYRYKEYCMGYIVTVTEAWQYCMSYIITITQAEKIVMVTSLQLLRQ